MTKLFQWMEVGGYKIKTTDLASDIAAFGEVLIKTTGRMPKETPPGFVKGTILLGYLIESKGVQWPLVKPIVENLEHQSDEDVAKMIMKLYNKIGVVEATTLAQLLRPRIANLIDSQRLEKVMTFVGFEKRMQNLSVTFTKKYGLPPTDYIYDSALEKVRQISCADFKAGRKIRFHDFFAKDFSDKALACDENKTYDWRVLW